jgi:hypothetical protein
MPFLTKYFKQRDFPLIFFIIFIGFKKSIFNEVSDPEIHLMGKQSVGSSGTSRNCPSGVQHSMGWPASSRKINSHLEFNLFNSN